MRVVRRIPLRFILLVVLLLSLIRSDPPPAPPEPDELLAKNIALPLETLCADLGTTWGTDWARVIAILEALHTKQEQCGGQDPYLQLYPAYYNYGAWLEARGNVQAAIAAYQQALDIQPEGREAALALKRHTSLIPPPPAACTVTQINAAQDDIPPYTPHGEGDFARLHDGTIQIDGQPFPVRGVN